MAFNLELIKTKLADLVHGVEAEIGPWAQHLLAGLHAVVESVHAQAVADEQTIAGQVAGDVTTVETAVGTATPAPVAVETTEPPVTQ